MENYEKYEKEQSYLKVETWNWQTSGN
jgi:hypothetical protein